MTDNKSNIFPSYNDKKLRILKRVIWFQKNKIKLILNIFIIFVSINFFFN